MMDGAGSNGIISSSSTLCQLFYQLMINAPVSPVSIDMISNNRKNMCTTTNHSIPESIPSVVKDITEENLEKPTMRVFTVHDINSFSCRFSPPLPTRPFTYENHVYLWCATAWLNNDFTNAFEIIKNNARIICDYLGALLVSCPNPDIFTPLVTMLSQIYFDGCLIFKNPILRLREDILKDSLYAAIVRQWMKSLMLPYSETRTEANDHLDLNSAVLNSESYTHPSARDEVADMLYQRAPSFKFRTHLREAASCALLFETDPFQGPPFYRHMFALGDISKDELVPRLFPPFLKQLLCETINTGKTLGVFGLP